MPYNYIKMYFLEEIDNYLRLQTKTQLTKGQRIFETYRTEIVIDNDSDDYFDVEVPSESGNFCYDVILCEDDDIDQLYMECNCPAYDYNGCKHCIAAAMAVRELLLFNDTGKTKSGLPKPEQRRQSPIIPALRDEEGYFHFEIENFQIDQLLQQYYQQTDRTAYKLTGTIRPESTDTSHQRFGFYEKKKKIAQADLHFDGNNGFKTRCTCNEHHANLCDHVIASFIYLYNNYGTHYFKRFKNFTAEKNRVLAHYGLTLDDPEAKEFEWEVTAWGDLMLRNKPASLIPAGSTEFFKNLKDGILSNSPTGYNVERQRMSQNTVANYEVGFLFNFASTKHIGLELDTLTIVEKRNKKEVKKLSIHSPANLPLLHTLSDTVFNQLIAFTDEKLIDWMANNGISSAKGYANPWLRLFIQDKNKLRNHYFHLLQQMWPSLCEEPFIYQLNEGKFSKSAIQQVSLSDIPAKLFFTAEADERLITVKMGFNISGAELPEAKQVYLKGGLIIEADQTLYLPQHIEDLALTEKFVQGTLKFPISEIANVISNLIIPLQSKYTVLVGDSMKMDIINPLPLCQLVLSEMDAKFLLLKPRFQYDDIIVDYDDQGEYIQKGENTLRVIRRNKPEEKGFYEFLRSLHPKFTTQRNAHYYFLPFDEVMKGKWFLMMVKQVQDAGFTIFGLQDLQSFRYNTNTPVFEIEADGSGIDWFDLKVKISWGDQQVPLSAIRKAILNKQEAILLDDGTLGMIPEEWLQQYGLLLKIGNEKDGSIKISKLHYSILDELGTKLNNTEVEREIAEKKNALSNYTGLQNYAAPSAAINAKLRPYQLTGFQWLQALNSVGWGGCLADDMGLGKTLQTITFLQFLKENNPGSVQLVICPTSLIFNWESELDKFCPTLKYHTYYGNQRNFDDSHFEQFDIILTTYGVLRLDVLQLAKFSWHYIVLDESQAIKNPTAQITQCLKLLKSKNRLILSGTPVQNNTSDLYAQFNFINPGFLGQYEFFKREFASPIDKYGDKLKSAQLRHMVYPFMLRRTKEQVAPDLPDKTEMVLWCSMGKEHRAIYEEYKNYYRDMLLQKIEEEGIGKSGIYVLEGLLRLRQICDHPVLVKGDAVQTTESVKIEELMREIRENSGGHKSLIFSQFSEMLKLISKELEQAGISYCYLDGSTSAKNRKEAVRCFQEDESIQVFLISLKAGGVGLNLTAADYVYLVDPWWNPAAEQQAIDRTHRIGQTRKIFAYKMICKDTIEEKILLLQQKKKSLANDLVNEDSGFVKKLTKEDIAFLFS